jgi:hypothetical protein
MGALQPGGVPQLGFSYQEPYAYKAKSQLFAVQHIFAELWGFIVALIVPVFTTNAEG